MNLRNVVYGPRILFVVLFSVSAIGTALQFVGANYALDECYTVTRNGEWDSDAITEDVCRYWYRYAFWAASLQAVLIVFVLALIHYKKDGQFRLTLLMLLGISTVQLMWTAHDLSYPGNWDNEYLVAYGCGVSAAVNFVLIILLSWPFQKSPQLPSVASPDNSPLIS